MKKRVGYILLGLGALSFTIAGLNINATTPEWKNENTTYLLTIDNSLCGNDEAVKESQDTILARLRNKLGFKFTVKEQFSQASNIIKITANSSLENDIKSIPGISKVNEDRVYTFGEAGTNSNSTTDLEEGYIVTQGYDELDDKDKADYVLKDEQKINYSAQSMNAPTLETESNLGKGTVIAILDASFMIDHTWFKDLDDSDVRLTKSKMKEIQDTGKLIGSAKTGVAQGELGSTYKNNKIPFYYDYGGDSDHNNVNDYDVLSRWDSHGTHVAGIAAANGDDYKGIAPNAQLVLMKVFRETITTSSGLTTASVGARDSDILEALEDCVLLGVDGINMSLGSDLDDFSDRSSSMDAFKTLKENGCYVAISAGNDGKENYSSMGPYSTWTTSMVETGVLGSYANDESSMIVAATTLEKNFYENALIVTKKDGSTQPVSYKDEAKTAKSPNDTPDDMKFETLIDKYGESLEYCYIGGYTGAASDDILGSSTAYKSFKTNYEKVHDGETFDATGKVAVVDRGDISFSKKATAAYEAGFAGLVVVNNDPTALEFNFSMAWGDSSGYEYPQIPVVFVLNRDKTYFKDNVNSEDGCGTLSIAKKKMEENPDKEQVATYSSEGATYDLRMNPDISAPGSNVLSCVPGTAKTDNTYSGRLAYYDKAWAYYNGTSMAAPNLSGANALILSDLAEGKSEEERKEIAKTLAMKEMSTANQYSYQNTKVVNKLTGETENDGVKCDYSPRRQGAGVIDVRKTIATDVYLEGLEVNNDGSFKENSGIGKAKIELKNNDLIKNGKISAKFLAHNDSDTDKQYKVSLNVLKPYTTEYYNYDNHKDEAKSISEGTEPTRTADYEFEDHTFQTTKDEVIHEKELATVTVKANGTTTISVEDSLSEEEKKAIDDVFESGTYIEGYITLTAVNDEDVDLSIPYMGFYGDYAEADAIEEFDFTRDSVDENGDTIFYPSDLVNYVGKNTSLSLTKMDVSSTICGMDYDTYYSLKASSDILYNKGNVKNAARVVTYNKETNTIYAGGTDSEVLYLQAFVLRSIESNSIVIKDSSGKVVNTVGDSSFKDSITGTNYLYKSHVSSNYVNSGVICHKASAYIPLYQANNKNLKLVDGNYTITINFKLMGTHTTQSMTYNLVIDSLAPSLQSKTYIEKDGEQYVRLKYKETYMTRTSSTGSTVVAVNGGVTNCDIKQYAEGYYIDFKLKDALENDANGKVSVDITDGSGNKIFDMFYLNDDTKFDLLIESTVLVPGSQFRVTATDNEDSEYDFNRTYKVTPYDYQGKTISESDFGIYKVSLSVKDAVDPDNIVVLDKSGNELVTKITEKSTISFETSGREFTIKYKKGSGIVPTEEKNMGAILGMAIGIPVGVIALGGAIGATLIIRKKKKTSTK